MDIIQQAYDEAVKVVHLCATKHGFFAAYPGYDMVFARDSMIISIGSSLIKDDKKIKDAFRASLITLGKNQSSNGQIPNAVDTFVSSRKYHVDYQSIDSTMWFIIGNYIYNKRYNDSSMLKKHKKHMEKALTWLACQDNKENGMLTQLPTTDWQDAFPHRYGFTIHSQALYYKTLNMVSKKNKADHLKKIVNHDSDSGLWDKNYYLPWRWKNHGKYQEKGTWFDSLGNVLSILTGLSEKSQPNKIFNYIKKHGIDKPYPMKASVWPPITPGSKDWKDYFKDNDARTPYHYINSGIWTYVGGFYVCALVKEKRFNEAKEQLKLLAEANLKKPSFSEWLHGKTGKPGPSASEKDEGNQGWNAAMFIAAYHSVKNKKPMYF